MKLVPGLAAAATLLITVGCGVPPPTLPPAPSVGSTSGSVATVPASPSPVSSPSVPAASVPDAAGAIDVSGHPNSAFASPSGAIWCSVAKNVALCHFPAGFKGKVPTSKKICPQEMLDVTGISVTKKVQYFCSGDPTAFPSLQNASNDLDWFKTSGFPTVKYNGFTLATLPYGQKLVDGNFICLSESSGVTCANSKLGVGFKMAKAGVTLIS